MHTMTGRKSRFIVALATLAIASSATYTCAAAPTPQVDPKHVSRDVIGTVTDSGHEPLSGAVVQVEDEDLKTVRSYVTDRTGRYSFLRVDGSADFKIWASFRGHQSASRTLSLFDTHTAKTLDLIIQLH